jgi:hypothetical protein
VPRRSESFVELGPLTGMNDSSNPLALGKGFATSAVNVELDPESSVANKRLGSNRDTSLGMNGGAYLLTRHIPPDATEDAAQLWSANRVGGGVLAVGTKTGAGAWVSQGVHADQRDITRMVSFNGKIFFAGRTWFHNRMFVWDGTQIRYAGLTPPLTAPSWVVIGPGALPMTLRYYKVDFRIIDANGATQARGDPSASVACTPPILHAFVRVTRPATDITTLSATHWVIWGSTDNVTFYQMAAPILIATTTYDDAALPANYDDYNGVQTEPIGTFTPLPAATRIITDGHRLLMSGNGSQLTPATAIAGELAPRGNRVWFTPVLGTLDQGDDERIPDTLDQRNWTDIGENIGTGVITELAGPVDGQVYCFNRRRTWRLVPTGDLNAPYITYAVSDRVGAVGNVLGANITAVAGENEHGQPAIYFLSTDGLYRFSQNNLQFVSYDVMGALRSMTTLTPFIFSNTPRKQIWIVMRATILVYQWDQGRPDEDGDVRGGWTQWGITSLAIGNVTSFTGAALHNHTPGTASVAAESLVPWLAPGGDIAENCFIFNRADCLDGGTTPYYGSVRYAPVLPAAGEKRIRVGQPQMVCTRADVADTVLTVQVRRDFGVEYSYSRILIYEVPPVPTSYDYLVRTLEGLFEGDITAFDLAIGDINPLGGPSILTPTEFPWAVQYLTIPVIPQESRG